MTEGNRIFPLPFTRGEDQGEGLIQRPFVSLTKWQCPQGEGELFPALEKVRHLVSFSDADIGGSLSWGEGQGEGERYF